MLLETAVRVDCRSHDTSQHVPVEKVSAGLKTVQAPAHAPAEQRGHEPLCVVTAAAARRFLDVLHVHWKNTSLCTSNVKSTALYQSTEECK